MKKLMVAIAAAAISFAGFADDTNNWFTAGFGAEALSSGGAWSPAASSLIWGDENVLVIEDVGADAPVKFAAEEAKAGAATNADSTVVFDTTVTFQGFEDLPTIEDGAKAGVCALTDGNYYVVAYDDVGLTNKWVDTGFEAAFDVAVNVKVTVANGKAVYTFTDQFGTDGTDPLDLVDAEFQEVCYSGNGSVTTLAADTILAGVAITLPEVPAGIKASCEQSRAAEGDTVTVYFAYDGKFPSVPSADYSVGADGSLTLVDGQPQVEALDPGAKIGTVFYLTFADAYKDAAADATIELCSDQMFGDVASVEKDVTVDINGFRFAINNNLEVSSALTITDSKLEEAAGLLVLGAVVDLGENGTLDISEVLWENVKDVGYVTGEGELHLGISPNLMFAKGALGEDMVIVYDEKEYFFDSEVSENRYVTEGEVAYGIIAVDDLEYEETFDSVQAAINATDEVYLCFDIGASISETELTFKANTIVYAYEGETDLKDINLVSDAGDVVFDASLGGWKVSGEPPTPTYYEVTFSTNDVEVVDAATTVEDGEMLDSDQVPEFEEEGTWDVDPLSAVITCDTNFNYTISAPVTTKQIQLPAATAGVAGYIVSNVTDGVAIPMEQGEQLGGVTYTLPLGAKIEIWVVPADGYRVTGNPYVINEVTSETTVDVQDLPPVAAIPYVAQVGDDKFESLQEAFASEAEGDIVLLDNVTLTETLSVNKDFVLNLGGKTLTSTLPSVAWAIRLGDTAEVMAVISNGTIVANQYGVRANQTDLTLDTVTIDSTLRALQSTTASDIDLVGCTISAAPNAEDEIAVLTKGGTLDIVDTTVNSGAKGLDLGGTVATIDADSVISVDGVNCAVFVGSDAGVKTQLTVAGKVEATASHTSDNDSIYAISGNGTDEIGADVTISEGADISVTADETAIYWPNAGTLTVNGGSIAGGTAIWAKSGNVVVNGGEISANGAAAPYAEDNDGVTPTGDAIVFEKLSGDATGYPNNLTASITGGTITSENGAAVVSVARAGETALGGVVSGGTFSSPIPDALCAAGFIPKANEDGTYGVKEGAYVAQVGEDKYETVEAALAAVQALEAAEDFPIEITALAEDGLTITDTDRTASIEKGVKITIPEAGSWEVDGTLTYSGAIEGKVRATDIVIADGGSITLGVDALVTVGLASELDEDSFTAPGGYKVMVMSTMDAKSFKVVEIPTYAITWTDPKNAVVVAIDEEGDEVESGDKYSEGCKIAFTVTPEENYTYAGVELGTAWTLLENGAISNLVTMGAAPVEVTIPEAVEDAPAWDIPGAEGGINALVKEDGVTKYVEFTSITFTATGATVGLKAAKIAAQAETFGLVCKTDLTKGDTFVINASLSVAEGDPDAKNGLFTISTDLSGYDQLFVVGVGQAKAE